MLKKTALITGASSGIGLEFAKLLAAKGYNLVLCARRKERLIAIGEELEKKFSVRTYSIQADLSKRETPDEIFKELRSKDITIDFLVNNAGLSLKRKFSRNSWEEIDDFMNLMMVNVTKLCHLVLPSMKEKKQGHIVNVSSIAAFVPEDSGSLYTASKKYVSSLSVALAKEGEPYGVKVLALCPGFTHTEFHKVLGNKEKVEKFPKIMWMTADRVVEEGYDAVIKGKRIHINGLVNKVICFIFHMIPECIIKIITPKKMLEDSYKSDH
jgi:short-subunit dehydrogenase